MKKMKRISTVMAASGAAVALMLTGDVFAVATLTNGSFEIPVIGTGTPVQTFGPDIWSYDESDVPGWLTTDSLNAIELWRSESGVPAYEGNQFAEINANSAGTLSTTVTPSLGSIIGFAFAHRGRASDTIPDVIDVNIYDLGPEGMVGFANDTLLLSEMFSDTSLAWGYYVRPLGISTGNTLLLEFTAFSSATGDPGVGNFLDAVGFGERVVPEPATGMLALIGAASVCVSRRRKAAQK